MLSGCLISQPVHFDEPPNSPPAIYDTSPGDTPFSTVVQYTATSTTPVDGGMTSPVNLPFVATVADADVDQVLEMQALVDGVPCATCVPQGGMLSPSPSMTGRTRRAVTLTVPTALLAPTRCHSVELVVSGHFVPGQQTSSEEGDLDRATWWVSSRTDSASAFPDMGTCP